MKFEQLPSTDKNGYLLKVENAIIKSVSLSTADHGILSGWLHIEFDCGGCGFGGFALGKPEGWKLSRKRVDYAAEWIVRSINVAGVESWEKIPGRPIRVLHEGLGGGIVAVGHFVKDEWFCPLEEWSWSNQ